MIRGVKFVTIAVSDQDRALAFYTQKLGFRVVTDQPYDAGSPIGRGTEFWTDWCALPEGCYSV
jgi:catechol 2,3-dioxygenase-like lactoylglutathione lyase family enzyme